LFSHKNLLFLGTGRERGGGGRKAVHDCKITQNKHIIAWNSKAYYLLTIKTQIKLHMHVKGKAIPSQAWRDPEGSRRLRLPDFKTIGTLNTCTYLLTNNEFPICCYNVKNKYFTLFACFPTLRF
jgi:hypothetical protein